MAKRSSDKSRYIRLPGTKKQYRDTAIKHPTKAHPQVISTYEYSKRTHGGVSGPERTARRRGYATASERRRAIRQARGRQTTYLGPYATVQETRAAERYMRQRAFARADQRQRELARVYAIKKAGPGRQIDLNAALQDPEFQALSARLRDLETLEYDHPDQFNDAFYAPDSEYARVLEALGRRIPNADYRVGMSGDAGYPLPVVIAIHQGSLAPGPSLGLEGLS